LGLMDLMPNRPRGLGIDISTGMIHQAKIRLKSSNLRDRVVFRQENAEELSSISQETIDFAFCVGAFEHMLDKKAVLCQVQHALKPKTRFLCLTHNGDSFWNKYISPYLNITNTHLSTDKCLDKEEITRLVHGSGYESLEFGYWSFIPKGDIRFPLGPALQSMDFIGKLIKWRSLREGLFFLANKY